MQPRDERQFLSDIGHAIDRITRYTAGGEDDFHANEMVQDAVIRQLEVIGEAATHVSETTRAKAPEIPWREVVATRNLLIHAYATIDLEVVWDTVRDLGKCETRSRVCLHRGSFPALGAQLVAHLHQDLP